MKRVLVFAAVFFLVTGLGAAQAQLDEGPGAVTPDSALYGLETAWDNAGIALGLKNAGNVAQERAAEARQMQEEGNHEAAARAAQEFSDVAEKAQEDDLQGLEKARAVLEEVMANAPAEAQEGLQTALDSVSQAQNRVQQEQAGEQNRTSGQSQESDGAQNESPDGQNPQ